MMPLKSRGGGGTSRSRLKTFKVTKRKQLNEYKTSHPSYKES